MQKIPPPPGFEPRTYQPVASRYTNYIPDYHVSNDSLLISVMNNIVCFYHSHLNKTTTYEDPRKDWTEEPPQPRQVELTRHQELGFGFVAGSEKPVIVRYSFKESFVFS